MFSADFSPGGGRVQFTMWWPAEGGQPGFLTSLWTLEGQDLLVPLIIATPFGRVLGARRGAKCFVRIISFNPPKIL